MTPSDAHAAIIAQFGFDTFSRLQARRYGLEHALWVAEAAGMVRFLRCAGQSYVSDLEQFRALA